MAKVLPDTSVMIQESDILLGKQLLDLIAAGMYSNPLMVLREYIQNATDSLDIAIQRGFLERRKANIAITINGAERKICIEDNGTGVGKKELRRTLLSIGASQKDNSEQRGFRGIGRLGGLGYCKKLRFTTKSRTDNSISVITWDSSRISELIADRNNECGIKEAISKAVSIEFISSTDSPKHFFRVELIGVKPFHQDWLMDINRVKNYLSQTAPVPYDKKHFTFAEKVDNHLANFPGYSSYNISLNDNPVFRPYSDEFKVSKNQFDKIHDVTLLDIQTNEGLLVGKGWHAQIGHFASIPRSNPIRGIRTRQGNIEIGDEYLFANSFSERRFATWHIGEIHVSYAMKPNARRDGFEPTPAYEKFLEYYQLFGKHLSQLCRDSSIARSKMVRLQNAINILDKQLDSVLFLDYEHFNDTRIQFSEALDKIRQLAKSVSDDENVDLMLSDIYKKFDIINGAPPTLSNCLDGRSFRHKSSKAVIQELSQRFMSDEYSNLPTERRLRFLLSPYLKASKKN